MNTGSFTPKFQEKVSKVWGPLLLLLAKQARDQFEEVTRVISSHDYSDPGDQNVEPF